MYSNYYEEQGTKHSPSCPSDSSVESKTFKVNNKSLYKHKMYENIELKRQSSV